MTDRTKLVTKRESHEGSGAKMARNEFESDDNLTLRSISPEEVDKFLELVEDMKSIVFPPDTWVPYDEEGLRSLLDDEIAHNIGLYDRDRLVGTAFLVKPGNTLLSGTHELALCGVPSKGTAELTHIMLDSDWRGDGLANAMVDELMGLAASVRGIHCVYALVHPRDKQSRKLFERSLFITCCGAKVPDGREMYLYQRWFDDPNAKDSKSSK